MINILVDLSNPRESKTKDIFVSALETLEDDKITDTGNTNIPKTNLLKLPDKTKKKTMMRTATVQSYCQM